MTIKMKQQILEKKVRSTLEDENLINQETFIKLEKFKKEFQQYSRLYLWGTGYDAELAVDYLEDLIRQKETFFIDINPAKWGNTLYKGIMCKAPADIQMDAESAIIITTSLFVKEIEQDLEKKDCLLPVYGDFIRILRFQYTRGHDNQNKIELIDTTSVLKHANDVIQFVEDERSVEVLYKYLIRKHNDRYRYIDIIKNDSFPSEIMNRMGKNEIIVACGAFLGDVVSRGISLLEDRISKLYIFEINNVYCGLKSCENNDFNERVFWHNAVLGDCNRLVYYSSAKEEIPRKDIFQDYLGKDSIEMKSLDDLVESGTIAEGVSFIQLSIPAGQIEALRGMKKILRKSVPQLAVTIYQWEEELEMIMRYLRSIIPSYRFLLRHHTTRDDNLVLYAYTD